MFDPRNSETPFLGPSQRLTPTIPTRAVAQPRARMNANLNPAYKNFEPATPQPVANDDTGVAAVRGSKAKETSPRTMSFWDKERP